MGSFPKNRETWVGWKGNGEEQIWEVWRAGWIWSQLIGQHSLEWNFPLPQNRIYSREIIFRGKHSSFLPPTAAKALTTQNSCPLVGCLVKHWCFWRKENNVPWRLAKVPASAEQEKGHANFSQSPLKEYFWHLTTILYNYVCNQWKRRMMLDRAVSCLSKVKISYQRMQCKSPISVM